MNSTAEALNGVALVLGEKNAEKLRERIANIIVEQVQNDMRNYAEYLLYPPDMKDLVKEAMEATEKKVSKMYKDAVIEINKDYIDKMKSYMANQLKDPEKSMRRDVIELAKTLQYTNNKYGRNRAIAKRLFEIAGLSQSEIKQELNNKEINKNEEDQHVEFSRY